MRKIFIILVSGVFTLMLSSCGLFGTNITDQESVNKNFPSVLEKHIDPQTVVFDLMMGTTQNFSFDMDVASITCLEPNATEPAKINFTLTGNQKPRRLSSSFLLIDDKKKTAVDGIKLNEIDFSHVAANVNKAIEMLKTEGYQADGVSSYDMTFNGNSKETKHHFRIRCKGDTNFGANKRGAAALVTEYVEFTFNADAEGNVSVEE